MELTTIWFILIAVLWVGYFVLEGFDFGVGILLPVIGRNEPERRAMIRTIGPVWDGNEVWLIVAGGAMFAAFPEWYATLFSGFYIALFAILVALIFRGIAIEYRNKRPGLGLADSLGLGHRDRLARAGDPVGRRLREHPAGRADRRRQGVHRDVLHAPQPVCPGGRNHDAAAVRHPRRTSSWPSGPRAACATGPIGSRSGSAWLRRRPRSSSWAGRWRSGETPPRWRRQSWRQSRCVGGILANRVRREGWAFLGTTVTIGLAVMTLFIALFPDVMPSSTDPAYSLTVTNASSTEYTLSIMTVVAVLFVPIVLVYQGWTYWVFRKRVTAPPATVEP